ncbi:ATP phosphoribosyltransferase [Aestuariivirga litoralis]|uniref:ATP phosphoribosyltransferase n=1 Tax=Aestuariivirga litoralis TaxID=2650924 RepID=UPI0018C60E7A|nr:ATP phosphoribosyltransferase [Aestuariivirga litoralis]MBG1233466.1 ATP phosphoribosyltransferase [Aestuariivirga litoralis]
MKTLTLGLPSKGRLMEQAQALIEEAGFKIERIGSDRGYRGILSGLPDVEVAFLSASDIASALKSGEIDAGITGEDLLREKIAPDAQVADAVLRLGFGSANVVVAVPDFWLDVAHMADLDEVAQQFYASQGRRLRVATKYLNLTRRFFAKAGVTGYRIVESLGATEGAPAAGSAELIVDITTSGATLSANHLKILDDGVILQSCAVLAVRKSAESDPRFQDFNKLLARKLHH